MTEKFSEMEAEIRKYRDALVEVQCLLDDKQYEQAEAFLSDVLKEYHAQAPSFTSPILPPYES